MSKQHFRFCNLCKHVMLQVMLLRTWPTDCARSCSEIKEASSFSAHRQEES